MLCVVKPNNFQSLSPLHLLLEPSQVSREAAVCVWVFVHCCRSSGSLPWETSHKEMGPVVKGKVWDFSLPLIQTHKCLEKGLALGPQPVVKF